MEDLFKKADWRYCVLIALMSPKSVFELIEDKLDLEEFVSSKHFVSKQRFITLFNVDTFLRPRLNS
jgi:hypothetical protein